MSITSFLNKLKYGSYKDSHRPAFYENVAKDFHVSPQHVYELYYGKTVRTRVDGEICDELLARDFGKENK